MDSSKVRCLRINQMLLTGKIVTIDDLLQNTGSSLSTIRRDLRKMRSSGYPIQYSASKGYFYEKAKGDQSSPAVWFSSPEILALAGSFRLISDVQKKQLRKLDSASLDAMKASLSLMLGDGPEEAHEILKRVAVNDIPGASVKVNGSVFETVGYALINQRRLRIHLSRSSQKQEKTVSPVRLELRRHGWVLRGFDHSEKELCEIKLSAVSSAFLLDKKAKFIAVSKLCKTVSEDGE